MKEVEWRRIASKICEMQRVSSREDLKGEGKSGNVTHDVDALVVHGDVGILRLGHDEPRGVRVSVESDTSARDHHSVL